LKLLFEDIVTSNDFLNSPPIAQEIRARIELGRRQWLRPIILAIQEAEMRRIVFRSQPWQIVQKTLS
jgi:hypothetical protein